MAAISAGKGSGSASGSIKYVQYEKDSTRPRVLFSEGIECSPYYQDAIEDFAYIRDIHHKSGGREAHHMVLAYSPEEEKRFTKKELFDKAIKVSKGTFPNHQIWLGMHNDTDHLHVHMIVNSVNLETGKKLQIAGRKGMHEIMNKVQNICHSLELDNTLEVGKRSQKEGQVITHNIVEYKLIEQGKSWKADIAKRVYESLNAADSKMDFILNCNEKGVLCKWDDNRKHVTFCDMDNPSRKVRSANLAKTFTLKQLESKESMEKAFKANKDKHVEQSNNEDLVLDRSKSLEKQTIKILKRNRSIELGR